MRIRAGKLMTTGRAKFWFWANLVLSGAVGVTLGVGLYTFWYAKGGSYFSTDPRACANCHIMREQYDSWQHTSHHAHANCVDCHLPKDFVGKYVAKAENGFWHSWHFTMQTYPDPIRIKPKNAKFLQDNCIRCHHDIVGDLLHKDTPHDESMNCVRCHADVGHGPRK